MLTYDILFCTFSQHVKASSVMTRSVFRIFGSATAITIAMINLTKMLKLPAVSSAISAPFNIDVKYDVGSY